MSKTLTKNVHVHNPETGQSGWFGPAYESSELPDWAVDSDGNSLVTREDLFEETEGYASPAAVDGPVPVNGRAGTEPESQGLKQSDLRGRSREILDGSAVVSQPKKSASRAEWEAYATSPAGGGMSAEEAASFSNKDELIAAATGGEDGGE